MRNHPAKIFFAAFAGLLALLAIAGTFLTMPPPLDRGLHGAIGSALARESSRLAGSGGHLIVITRDPDTHAQPAVAMLLNSLRRELKKAGSTSVSLHLLQIDPIRPTDVPPGDFFELLRKGRPGDVIISLLGPPLLTEEQRARLGVVRPHVVAFCSGNLPERVDLQQLFQSGLLHAAVASRLKPVIEGNRRLHGAAAFEQLYEVIRANDAAAPVPASAVDAGPAPRSMKTLCSTWGRRHVGFTRADLIAAAAALLVIGALVVVPLRVARGNARLSFCTRNLREVARGVLLYAEDHGKALPGPVAAAPGDFWWWYKDQVKGYLGMSGPSTADDSQFGCPDDRGYSDPKPFRATPRFDYNSYAFNGVGLVGTPNIAGWQVSSVIQPSKTLAVMEWTAHAPLSWHRSRTGRNNAPFYCDARSVVAFVDGHVSFIPIYYDGYNAAYTRDPIPGYDYRYSGK